MIEQQDLICFNQTRIAHNDENIFILDKHATHEGTWSLFTLTEGSLDLIYINGAGEALSRTYLDASSGPTLIPPAVWHQIEPHSDAFYADLEFYCKRERYFSKKHQYGAVHPDFLYAYQTYLNHSKPLRVLDVGSGAGRNALYLALCGHQVDAIDINEKALKQMVFTAQLESLSQLSTQVADLNQELPRLQAPYDFILSTVCLQFLNPGRIPNLLAELQGITTPAGIHCLVYPVFDERFTLPSTFTFMPEPEAVMKLYQDRGWSILEHRLSVGKIHRIGEDGKPIQGLFALLVAQKHP